MNRLGSAPVRFASSFHLASAIGLAALLSLLPATPARAQGVTLPPSGDNEKAVVTQYMGPASVTVEYHSPDVHAPDGSDRHGKIWGGLVPYGYKEEGFDPSYSKKTRYDGGLGHAFARVLKFLSPQASHSIVPIMVNTYYPPNQPTPKRCHDLGIAVRRAVEAWESGKRVAVLASGGLSHIVIDEPLDVQVLDALKISRAIELKHNNNWVLFPAMIEAALGRLQGQADVSIASTPVERSP